MTRQINPVLAYMKVMGIPMTRENYIALAFAGDDPSPEEELDIPAQFRKEPLNLIIRVRLKGNQI